MNGGDITIISEDSEAAKNHEFYGEEEVPKDLVEKEIVHVGEEYRECFREA